MVGNDLQLIDVHFKRSHDYVFNQNKILMSVIFIPPNHTHLIIKFFYYDSNNILIHLHVNLDIHEIYYLLMRFINQRKY